MQDSLVVTGKFLGAKPTEEVGQNGFLKRVFYLDITTNTEYPNTPEFLLTGDKVNLVDNLTKGQTVQVKFNIDGRKFTSKATGKEGVITQLRAWKIDVIQKQSAAVATPAPVRTAPSPATTMSGPGQYAAAAPVAAGFEHQGETNDDLPF
jgi:hypothetical protein